MIQERLAQALPAAKPSAKIHPMIVAAGSGSRFQSSLPKQFTPIFGKTILEHSVRCLAKSAYIDCCLLVISASDDFAPTLNFELPVSFAIGGAERWQSVQAGVTALIAAGAQEHDFVLIHDAARPTVPVADIDNVIQAAFHEPFGAILAAPVVDTLKQAFGEGYIEKTVDRSQMWQAQTPQVFRLGALAQALAYIADNNISITDEASAFEALNLPIKLVSGSRQNIKLTFPEDELIIKALIKGHID